jgi:hypothetical protein
LLTRTKDCQENAAPFLSFSALDLQFGSSRACFRVGFCLTHRCPHVRQALRSDEDGLSGPLEFIVRLGCTRGVSQNFACVLFCPCVFSRGLITRILIFPFIIPPIKCVGITVDLSFARVSLSLLFNIFEPRPRQGKRETAQLPPSYPTPPVFLLLLPLHDLRPGRNLWSWKANEGSPPWTPAQRAGLPRRRPPGHQQHRVCFYQHGRRAVHSLRHNHRHIGPGQHSVSVRPLNPNALYLDCMTWILTKPSRYSPLFSTSQISCAASFA